MSKTVVNKDLMTAVNMGLIIKESENGKGNHLIFHIQKDVNPAIQWAMLSPNVCQILETIIRNFGCEAFSRQQAAEILDMIPANLAYFLKTLTSCTILKVWREGQQGWLYKLGVPLEEAIHRLQERGFAQVALVG